MYLPTTRNVVFFHQVGFPSYNRNHIHYMSRRMGKPAICKGENKGAGQLRSNCEAEQLLCFRYTDSTIPLLSKSKFSSLYPSSMTVQPGLCRTWSQLKLFVFSCTGSYDTADASEEDFNEKTVIITKTCDL